MEKSLDDYRIVNEQLYKEFSSWRDKKIKGINLIMIEQSEETHLLNDEICYPIIKQFKLIFEDVPREEIFKEIKEYIEEKSQKASDDYTTHLLRRSEIINDSKTSPLKMNFFQLIKWWWKNKKAQG